MAEKLVTVMPAEDFAAYPFGKKVEFRTGVESIPVPADYGALLKEKGHIKGNPAPVKKAAE